MINTQEFQESIAIIDDEIEIARAIHEILIDLNYKAFFTTNAEELFEYVAQNQVFLIISDYSMPEKTGIQVCHEIKKTHPFITFLLFTGYADKDIAIKALKEGINDVLEKPQDFKKIPEVVEKYAKNRLQYIEREKNELEILKQIFLDEAQEIMNDLDEYILKLEDSNNESVIDIVFRKIHTLKGSSGAFPHTEDLSKLLHSFETLLSKLKNKELQTERNFIDLILEASDIVKVGLQRFSGQNIDFNPSIIIEKLKNYKNNIKQDIINKEQKIQVFENDDDSIQVSHEKLESFMELSGELIVFKNMLQTFLRDMAHKQDNDHFTHAVEDYNQTLEKISEEFQNQIMNVRKVQLQKAFSKFPRLMRQLSQDMKKSFKYDTEGLDLGVDKNIAKALTSSLVHLLRNAADHGMDTSEERIQKGKNPQGTIKLSCFQRGDVVLTIIEDDGRGIHKDKIISKAKEKNLVLESTLSQMTDEEIYELIFLPGFSTAEQISNVSGRGVGMDVVKTEIARLNGTIQIKSEINKGTQFLIQIPIPKTVIVENSIMALSNNVTLAIPLTSIDSITSAKELNLQSIQNIETCQYKERTIRIGHYYEYLKTIGIKVNQRESFTDTIVILQHKDELVGLKLDKIIGQQEAVIRSFDPIIENIPGFKGTSLLDNEKIAYVIDAEKIIEISKNIQDQGE